MMMQNAQMEHTNTRLYTTMICNGVSVRCVVPNYRYSYFVSMTSPHLLSPTRTRNSRDLKRNEAMITKLDLCVDEVTCK